MTGRADTMRRSSILSTLPYWDERKWMDRVSVLDRRRYSKFGRIVRLFRASRRYETIVLDGTSRWDQLSAVAITRRRRPPRVFITDCTWKRGSSRADRAACWFGLRFIDGPHVTYGVLSSEEAKRFSRTWGVDPDRVVYTPFCHTLTKEELAQPTSDGGYVFAGGNSMRDYDTLIAAAAMLPDRFRVATRLLNGNRPLPSNVEAGTVSHPEFIRAMGNASVVVVPIPAGLDRSAGQQTYLNAMALGKLVIVSDVAGARDHVENRRTGIIVPPEDPRSLAQAITWALDPENCDTVAQIRARAESETRARFTRARYVDHLLATVDRN